MELIATCNRGLGDKPDPLLKGDDRKCQRFCLGWSLGEFLGSSMV